MDGTQKWALGLAAAVVLVGVAGNLPGVGRMLSGTPQAQAPEGASTIIHLTSAAFPALQAQPKPVVIDFWAPWCGPCRTQGPILEAFAVRVGDRALVAKVNVDDERALATQYGVRTIPTLIILKQGKVVQRLVGVHSAQDLLGALDAN